MKRISKVLIANRGEIAVRIARTCRVMGIGTVAVYSDVDEGALHVRVADEARHIGPAEAAGSYLNVAAILDAARDTGADAVHPGYGFLSESPELADAVESAGLVFVGPPADVHARMGDKRAARRLMGAAGVTVVPGYDGDDQQDATLLTEAGRVGWPILVKPARGGGGKGMRVARDAGELAGALGACRREASSAFGDDTLILERYVERSRHVEVQVLGDGERVVHLFERECSIQRRHQKVVEESPSPGLDAQQRVALCEAGRKAAETVGYRNAGTVEFLLDPVGDFFFLEMNTRLQVEHPVTEAVTGLDLVRLQLETAASERLPLAQEQITSRGHSIECRLYAEDPDTDDLPSPGTILHFHLAGGPGVRVDSGVETGSVVSTHYDPLLAKLITWGADRSEAIDRMSDTLRHAVALGVTTNHARLRAIVESSAFRAGELHTGFIAALASAPVEPLSSEALASALVASERALRAAPEGQSRHDSWQDLGHWRLGRDS